MKKLIAGLAVAAGVLVAVPAADASPNAYSRVRHIVQGPNAWITVLCHDKTTGAVKQLAWNEDSFTKCPLSGWVDAAGPYGGNTCHRLRIQNRANGAIYDYGWGATGNIPGGDYNAWLIKRC